MSGVTALVGSPSQAALPLTDSSISSVRMLIDGDFPVGQYAYNSDASSTGVSVVANGAVRPDTRNPFSSSGDLTVGSAWFPGTTSDFFSFTSSAPLQFGTGDFTAEAWVYRQDAAAANTEYVAISNVSANNNNSWSIRVLNNKVSFAAWSQGWGETTTTLAQNTWYHVAVTRSGTTLRIFINGVLDVTTADVTTNFSSGADFQIGKNVLANTAWRGYISNVRLVKGSALYTSNFTPSTTPLGNVANTSLLTLQTAVSNLNNQFLDASPSANAVTVAAGTPYQGGVSPYVQSSWGGSFNGSTDYLEFASNAAFAYGTGDYTVEGWFNSRSDWATMAAALVAGDNTGGLVIYVNSGTLRIAPQNSSSTSLGSVASLGMNTWYHIAVTRKSGSTRAYVNGLPIGSAVSDTASYGNTVYRIGGSTDGKFNGWISNVRAVKGTAVYDPASSSITVPTFTLQRVSGTSLLALTASTFNDASSNNFTPTVVGTPTVTTKTPFGQQLPTGSTYFNGSSAITVAGSGALGSGNFTVECWVNVTVAISTVLTFVGNTLNAGGGDNQWDIDVSSTGFPRFNGWVTSFLTSGTALTTNTWNHIAVVRNGTTLTMYLNGVSVASATNSTNFSSTNSIVVGRRADATRHVTGYIADVRVIPGTAVYTSAFVPPNRPVPSTAQTTCLISSTPGPAFDVSRNTNLQFIGTSRVVSSTRKYSSGSILIPGVGSSYVRFITTPAMALGSGDFTLEFWFNQATLGGYLIDFSINSTNGTAPQLYFNGSNLSWWVNTGDRILGPGCVAGAWNHVAVCRSSGTTRMFINGTQAGSNYTDATVYTVNTFGYIGASAAGPNGNANAFHIDGIRITPGVARYTTTFTPPATQFPLQ